MKPVGGCIACGVRIVSGAKDQVGLDSYLRRSSDLSELRLNPLRASCQRERDSGVK